MTKTKKAPKVPFVSAYLQLSIKNYKSAPHVKLTSENSTMGKEKPTVFGDMCKGLFQRVIAFYAMLYQWDMATQIEQIEELAADLLKAVEYTKREEEIKPKKDKTDEK